MSAAAKQRQCVPHNLAALKIWACYARKDDKRPLQPNGANAKSDDPSTWSTLEDCQKAVREGRAFGVGIMRTPGFDPDDPVHDDPTPWDIDEPPPDLRDPAIRAAEDFIDAAFWLDLAARSTGGNAALLGRMTAAPNAQQYLDEVMPIIAEAVGAVRATLRARARTARKQQRARARRDDIPGTAKAVRQLYAEGLVNDATPIDTVMELITFRWPKCPAKPEEVLRVHRRLQQEQRPAL
jgi:hypothetical protein